MYMHVSMCSYESMCLYEYMHVFWDEYVCEHVPMCVLICGPIYAHVSVHVHTYEHLFIFQWFF